MESSKNDMAKEINNIIKGEHVVSKNNKIKLRKLINEFVNNSENEAIERTLRGPLSHVTINMKKIEEKSKLDLYKFIRSL